jgi:NADP-dependent 3-hydroxy acid dehydrogenase YdfG
VSKTIVITRAASGFGKLVARQLGPQSMADVIVDVVLSDRPKFRNVHQELHHE